MPSWYDNNGKRYSGGGVALSTKIKPQSSTASGAQSGAPVTVYPATRKDRPARVCARCFARNLVGETFCKVCGDELPEVAVAGDLRETRRIDVARVVASLVVHGAGEDGADIALPIEKDIVLVGRASPSDNVRPDIDLSQFDESHYVSRRHAFLLRRQGSLMLEDLESANGTFVNHTSSLAPHSLVALHDGDDVTFGRTRCTIRIEGD
jgi:FHA domain